MEESVFTARRSTTELPGNIVLKELSHCSKKALDVKASILQVKQKISIVETLKTIEFHAPL